MLQKTAIKRKNKIVVGISYEYSDEEVEEFMLAKFFKDCGYTYPEIKIEMEKYKHNKEEVLDNAISKMESKLHELESNIEIAKKLRQKEK